MGKLELRIDNSSFFDESEVVDLEEPCYKMDAHDLQALPPLTQPTESMAPAESAESMVPAESVVPAAESAAKVPEQDLAARVGHLPERAQRSVWGSKVELGNRKS